MRTCLRWMVGAGIGLVVQAAVAEGERPLREARSANGRFTLRVEPGRPGRTARGCQATLVDGADLNSRRRRVWERTLVNDVAPAQALIRDDGRFVVTLDEYRRGGARHALVIYGAQGELLRHFVLTDLLEKVDWSKVTVERRAVRWLQEARPAFDTAANEFVIQLASGRTIRVDLKTLRVVRGKETAGADEGAVPAEVLALLLDHGVADETPPAEPLAGLTEMSPEERAQAAAIAEQVSAETGASTEEQPTETAPAAGDGRVTEASSPESRAASGTDHDAAAAPHSIPPEVAAAAATASPYTRVAVPMPNLAERVDYVAWLNELGRVSGPDANPLYQDAIARIVPWQDDGGLIQAALRGDPAALRAPELAQWLASNADALATFRAASQVGARGWNFQSNDGSLIGILLPDLAGMRTLARAGVIEGRRLADAGRPAEAAQLFMDVLAAGADAGSGMTIIENLVGVAIQASAADALLDLQAAPGAEALDFAGLAQDAATAYRPLRPAADTVQGERAMALDSVQRMWDVDPRTGAVTPNVEFAQSLFAQVGNADTPELAEHLARVGYEDTVAEVNLYYNAITEALAQPHPEARRRLESLENVLASSPNTNPILRVMAPSLARYETLRTRGEAVRRAALLVTNLHAYQQAHGEYPESLEAFAGGDFTIDPYSNGGFVYRRSGDGFLLYSVGGNGADDAGVHDPKGDTNDLVFWPRPK